MIIKELSESQWRELKKFNYESIQIKDDSGYLIGFIIPKELVINDLLISERNWVTVSDGGKLSCKGGFFPNYLKLCTGLTTQEYFDLLVLHINDTNLRPKCAVCGDDLYFSGRITYGYGGGGHRWSNKVLHYCSNRCTAIGKMTKLEYPNLESNIVKCVSLSHKSAFISMGSDSDDCYFYIASKSNYPDYFKFGVTSDPYNRKVKQGYSKLKILYKSSRRNIAELEYNIKMKLNQCSEWIRYSNSSSFRSAFLKSISEQCLK